jgi:two-component system, OmpR family, KDP operon response regulator KdpE
VSETKRFLIIDDEPSIRKVLRINLQDQNTFIFETTNGADALKEAKERPFDLIILDLGLPDMSGFDILVALRKFTKVPILILTVKAQEEDKVRGLDLGADDYLVKPFSVGELKARIRVALRHSANMDTDLKYNFGPFKIDSSEQKAFCKNQDLHLSQIEFRLLDSLCRRSGKIVSSKTLLQEIWGPNSAESGHYLRIYIGHLRKKILAENIIITEPGLGYRVLDAENND